MSKKHYEMLARLVGKWHINFSKDGFVAELMDILQEDNPSFNREKFLEACRGE